MDQRVLLMLITYIGFHINQTSFSIQFLNSRFKFILENNTTKVLNIFIRSLIFLTFEKPDRHEENT